MSSTTFTFLGLPLQRWLVLFVASLVMVMAAFGYSKTQQQIRVGDGYGWDGRHYGAMFFAQTGQMREGFAAPEFPFCKRIGVPIVAAKLGLQDFRRLNIAAGLLTAMLVLFVALRRLGPLAAVAATLPLTFYVFAPIRFANFYPWTVDPMMTLLMAAALVAFEFRWRVIGVGLLIAATLFKETAAYFAVLAIAAFFWLDSPYSLAKKLAYSAAALALLAAASGAYKIFYPACSGSSLKTIIEYSIQFATDPWRVLAVVSGALLVIGPFLYGFSTAWIGDFWREDATAKFAILSLVTAFAMGAVAGSDCTRIPYICFPLYAPVLFSLISRTSTLSIVCLAGVGLLANRWLTAIPQPAADAPDLHTFEGYFVFFPDMANPAVGSVIVLLFVSAYLLLPKLEGRSR